MKYQRALLRDVQGYTPGEQPKGEKIIKLNTNENPYPPAPQVLDAIRNLNVNALMKYPDSGSEALRAACAKQYGLPNADWTVAGNGMDELLAMVLRAFVDPGDDVLTVYPTYSLYEVLCNIHGCNLRYIELDEKLLPTDSFYSEQARLCFLTRPNAPTGISISRADVERFCNAFNGIVVIDEAYVDFADDHCMDFPERFDNVIVMRTFSKSFGMAGARIGIAAAQPPLISEFMKIKDSYNMNILSQTAGLAAIHAYEYMQEQARKIRTTRERLRKELITMGFEVPPSQANFLLARWTGTPVTATLFTALRERNILVRYFAQPRLDDALRITIGNDYEIDSLLAALEEIISEAK